MKKRKPHLGEEVKKNRDWFKKKVRQGHRHGNWQGFHFRPLNGHLVILYKITWERLGAAVLNQSGSQIRALSPELSVDIRFETRSRSTPSLTFNLNLRRGKVDIIFSCLNLFHFISCSNWMPQNCGCIFKCLVFFIDLLDASVASLLADSVSHQLFVTCSTTSLLQG